MRTSLSILAGLAIAGLAFSPLYAAEGKAPAKEVKKPAPAHKGDSLAKGAGFADNLDELATAVGLSEEQKTKLRAMKETCAKDLDKYDKANEAKLGTVQTRLDKLAGEKGDKADRDRKELKAFQDNAKAGREALQAANEKKMFGMLNPQQRAKWNTPILQNEINKEFSMTFLDARQEERITSFCANQAKSLTQPLDAEKLGKSLDAMKVQVFNTILTPKQQVDYRKSKAPMTVEKPAKGR
jgi:hypothetical protein